MITFVIIILHAKFAIIFHAVVAQVAIAIPVDVNVVLYVVQLNVNAVQNVILSPANVALYVIL